MTNYPQDSPHEKLLKSHAEHADQVAKHAANLALNFDKTSLRHEKLLKSHAEQAVQIAEQATRILALG